MKGVIFTEFLEMVDQKFSPELTESLIEKADLESGAAYTAVGTYDYREIVKLVILLAEKTNGSAAELQQTFGEYLFQRLATMYPGFFKEVNDAFSFLERLDDTIHVEVLKLYPDAELPQFEDHRLDPNTLELVYRSARPFADLAEGLIRGCIAHFGEAIDLAREDLAFSPETKTRFVLTRKATS